MNEKQILIIEDDPLLGRIYTEVLEDEGHRVNWIQDGSAALQTLQTQTLPDLILLDLHLPGMSGKDVLAALQQDKRFAQIKIVIATADGLQAKELKTSVNLVLLKPISYEQLTELCPRLFAEV